MYADSLKQKSFFGLILYGARPKTLVASFFPVILGMILARFDGHYNIAIYLYTLFAAMFLQIGANYANDFFDNKAERDTINRLGPPRLASSGLLSKEMILTLTITFFLVATILTIPLIQQGGNIIFYLLVFGIFLGVCYSFGRYSLANTGLSNIVVFIVFGPLSTMMTYYLQTFDYSLKAAFFGILPGALSLMLFAMNNLRDLEEDKKSNKKTLVVRFGFWCGKMEYTASLFLALLLPPLSMMLYKAPMITLLPLILIKMGMNLSMEIHGAKDSLAIIPLFEKTAKFNTLYALLYIIGWRLASL